MAFPNDIETGIGLAGPTADIGHEDAHAASGIPRLIQELQTQIGTQRAVKTWTPTWNMSTQPSTQTAYWAKYGPLVWFSVYALWTTSATLTSGNTLKVTGGFPAWGTIAGNGPWLYAVDATGTVYEFSAKYAGGAISFYKIPGLLTVANRGVNDSVAIDGVLWASS